MTRSDGDTPLAVFTVDQIYSLKPGQFEARLMWMRSQGIEPSDAFRVEIYRSGRPGGGHYARVSAYARDGDGHRHCVLDHVHGGTGSAPCQLAEVSYDVDLSALPREAL